MYNWSNEYNMMHNRINNWSNAYSMMYIRNDNILAHGHGLATQLSKEVIADAISHYLHIAESAEDTVVHLPARDSMWC